MFKKQKEKLQQQIAFAKIDIKESAKKKILDAVSPQEPPQRHYDYSGQKEIKFHLERDLDLESRDGPRLVEGILRGA